MYQATWHGRDENKILIYYYIQRMLSDRSSLEMLFLSFLLSIPGLSGLVLGVAAQRGVVQRARRVQRHRRRRRVQLRVGHARALRGHRVQDQVAA